MPPRSSSSRTTAATRTFLADNLTADGYDVLVADTARDALRLLERKYPDLALIDLGLPDGDGLALVERVRARTAWPRGWIPMWRWSR